MLLSLSTRRTLLAWVGLLYNGVQCMVTLGTGPSQPIPVEQGIRQGCHISGQLYNLAIEALLWKGLINIRSKIASFRLQTAQRLLYNCGPSWFDTVHLLRRAWQLDYDKQLFLLQPETVDLPGLTLFYSSVLQSWQIFNIVCNTNETCGKWLFEEPLFFNSLIKTLQSASL